MIDVESRPPECYIGGMSRPTTNKEKKTEKVSAKVTEFLKTEIARIMEEEDRTESYVASALMMRGLAAYNQDKSLFEPDGLTTPDAASTKARVLNGHRQRADRSKTRQA